MILCHKSNYKAGRTAPIAYLVVHYTAGNGDTAADNCRCFQHTAGLYASAHYFVDEKGWEQSVADFDTAWHCGAAVYRHSLCRNGNSLAIELCSRKDGSGQYCFLPQTVANALELVRQKQKQYQIPTGNVLRHYDVTGKVCPAPFVRDEGAWQAFLQELEEEPMTQAQFDAMMASWLEQQARKAPDTWSEADRQWAEQAGIIQGDADGRKRYKSFVTREELAATLHRAAR